MRQTLSLKRWSVEYTDEVFTDLFHRRCFTEYEDAVILAKVKGTNQIYDRLEGVMIDL